MKLLMGRIKIEAEADEDLIRAGAAVMAEAGPGARFNFHVDCDGDDCDSFLDLEYAEVPTVEKINSEIGTNGWTREGSDDYCPPCSKERQ